MQAVFGTLKGKTCEKLLVQVGTATETSKTLECPQSQEPSSESNVGLEPNFALNIIVHKLAAPNIGAQTVRLQQMVDPNTRAQFFD